MRTLQISNSKPAISVDLIRWTAGRITCSGGNFLVSLVVRSCVAAAKQAQRMKKTFVGFVAVAAIAGSLAATRASAQGGVAAGLGCEPPL
jgi:hypothetical protein